MKFLYSDSLDFVDPNYDFVADQVGERRRAHTDDEFPHEHMDKAPYDGLLVSRAIVGDAKRPGKYSEAQCMRFWREGARAFLRYPVKKYPNSMIMGDCGAFSYRDLRRPPYTVDETLDFYHDGEFTHGCSVDHLIFDFLPDRTPAPAEAKRRYDITLDNAEKFIKASKALGKGFTALGVIQGWSAASMAKAATALYKQGFKYLAIGGMVPLQIDQIEVAVGAIRAAVPSSIKLHALGFGKTEELDVLRRNGVSSFDTTSPLLRAFKDGRRNYYRRLPDGQISYYMAVRIPQALDNADLLRHAKKGRLDQDDLASLETKALGAVRRFARRKQALSSTLDAVLDYGRYALWDDRESDAKNEARLVLLRKEYGKTLGDRPWEACACRVCRESGVEALIFRSSNRNKRRGMHNLQVFYEQLRQSPYKKRKNI
jgi:hypothetical protein